VFDSPDLELAPYAGFDTERFAQRTYCSWDDAGWRSLLVQWFTHRRQAEDLRLPAVADLHLVLCTHGDAAMRIEAGGKAVKRRWGPGRLELMVPGRETVRDYRGDAVVEQVLRSLPTAGREGDVYAESAAAFLAVHLLARSDQDRRMWVRSTPRSARA
jgi:AraC family transcriptional regulator